MVWSRVLVMAALSCVLAGVASAQDSGGGGGAPAPKAKWPPSVPGVTWTSGPSSCNMRDLAEVKIPQGWTYTDADGTRTMLRAMGNLTGTTEAGSVFPGSDRWFAVFEFDACGYVKDDEKSNLDADEIFETRLTANKEGNTVRKSRGLPALELVGWHTKPHYDETTHNLEWCLRLKAEGSQEEDLNYEVRLLGRTGVMNVTLVCGPSELDAALPEFRQLLADYSFSSGKDYGSWRSGDKVAEYGLGALAAGGAVALAAKTGILGKLWKFIALGLAGVVTWLKRLFGGKGKTSAVRRRPTADR